MKADDLETQMRALEFYHSLRFLPGAWLVLRLDGRGFPRFTGRNVGAAEAPSYREAGANDVIVDRDLSPADDDPASTDVIAMRAGALVEVCGEIAPGRLSRP